MGLYQRPDSEVYWISYNGSDGRRVRESTRTTDKEAAKRLLKDREGARKDEEGGTIPGAANGTINRELVSGL